MDIFVHIGMSKAGSSAIQTCLLENRKILKEKGIEYPLVGIPGTPGSDGLGHHNLADQVKEGKPIKLRKILKYCGCSVLVLSCEEFWLLGDEEVETLRRELRGHNVEIVFYLRNPRTYLPSSYRQNIKRAGESCSPEDYFDPHQSTSRLNFSYQLKRWEKHFPLRVRAYEAVKHEIEVDFMRAIGAPIDQVDTSRRTVNTTPSDGTIRVMLLANRYLPDWMSRYVRRLLSWSELNLDFIPYMDDRILKEYANNEMDKWNKEEVKRHLTEGDWEMLKRGNHIQ